MSNFFQEISDTDYEILSEKDEGQKDRFYIYDFENEDILENEFFNTKDEAQEYLDLFLLNFGTDRQNGMR